MRKLVPDWFLDDLHKIIYSDAPEGWLLAQGLWHAKDLSPQDMGILRKHAQGRDAAKTATLLSAKRSMVRQHLGYMRGILGRRFMRDISGHPSVVGAMIAFSRRRDAMDANVCTVLRELARLNATEIGVLCCMVQRLSEREALKRVRIMRRQYYDIKSKLRSIMNTPL